MSKSMPDPFPARGPDVDLVSVLLPRYIALSLLEAVSMERPPTAQEANVVALAIVDATKGAARRRPNGPSGTRGML
jgi:hypothetical protein